jgi:hypothetical protein
LSQFSFDGAERQAESAVLLGQKTEVQNESSLSESAGHSVCGRSHVVEGPKI